MLQVPTTIDYHQLILDTADFRAGNVDTGFIPSHAEELAKPPTSGKLVRPRHCLPTCSSFRVYAHILTPYPIIEDTGLTCAWMVIPLLSHFHRNLTHVQ